MPKLMIFLHGYGDNGPMFARKLSPLPMEVLTPNGFARLRLGEEQERYSWFRVQRGIVPLWFYVMRAVVRVNKMIDQEIAARGLSDEDVVLCGFSQGAALALYSALFRRHAIGGVICHSGFFKGRVPVRSKPPMLFLAGAEDKIVPADVTEESSQKLAKLGCRVQSQRFDGVGHRVSAQAVQAMEGFLESLQPSP